ncbi:hypothetical protein Q7A53_15405 [Halobacillus rhizosphaerae]|uniref:hypothetical protein n=1 Tax=Halobacillus rhizosphaerae TaxID=3064889 RepID=UPI00398AF75B
MNLRKIKLIIGITLFTLILAAAGTAAYFLTIKDYGVQDAEVDNLVQDDYQLDEPELAEEPSAKTASASPTADSNSSPQSASKKMSVKEIKAAYQPTFDDLQTQVKDRLEQLANKAKKEYNDKKAKKEDISYMYFLTKYKKAADELESKTDKAFNKVYDNMQDDLMANGHNENAANEMKRNYENEKERLKSKVMATALNKF